MSEKINDGGTAFPLYKGINHRDAEWQGGMSLRDYFAAAALTGLAARMGALDYSEIQSDVRAGGHEAGVAYTLADAMLKERTK